MQRKWNAKKSLITAAVLTAVTLSAFGWLIFEGEEAAVALQSTQIAKSELWNAEPEFFLSATRGIATPIPEPTATPKPKKTPTPRPTATPEIRQVDVIAPPGRELEFGETAWYSFELVNQGNITDRFTLELRSEHGFPTGRIPQEVVLKAGERITIATFVSLSYPGNDYPNFSDLPSSDELTLRATSVTDSSVHDADSVVTELADPNSQVTFRKSADKSILVPGEAVEYTFRYRNTGNVPLLNVMVIDSLPDQLSFEGSSIPAQIRGDGTLRFDLQPVLMQNEGGSFTLRARVKQDADIRRAIINQAKLSADGLPQAVNAQSRSSIEVPDLSIIKDMNRSALEVGDIALFTVRISNNGNGTASDLQILDTLPTVLRYTEGSSVINGEEIQDPQHRGNNSLLWKVRELRGGDEITLRYQATVAAGSTSGRYKNSVKVEALNSAGHALEAGPVKQTFTIKRADLKGLADIEGLVFWDKNENRVFDADEVGLPGITIVLVREGRQALSDEDGDVFFSEVRPEEQAVGLDELSLPQGFHLTTDASVLLRLGERDLGYVEFGVQTNWAELNGLVFHDLNANGRYDDNEPGIEGLSLSIDEKQPLTSDAEGRIRFTQLAPGPHSLMIQEDTIPSQFLLQGDAFFLKPLQAQSATLVYFPVILRPGSITARVFYDENGNGRFDSDEHGFPGVELLLESGSAVKNTTDEHGRAAFTELPPQAYSLRIVPESLPYPFQASDSLTQSLILDAGQAREYHWALTKSVDLPEFSVPTPGPTPTPTQSPTQVPTLTPTPEAEVCAFTVRAGDTLSTIAETLTGKASNYLKIAEFNGLESDTIQVGDVLNLPKKLLLDAFQECHFAEDHVVAGRIYYDRNANGQYDAGIDLPIPGVSVSIHSDVKSTVSDEHGYYRFEGMEPGGHVVWIDPQTLPEPYRPLDVQPEVTITVYPGQSGSTTVVDFIVLKAEIYQEGVVEGMVCLDLNHNGNCDADEPGIVGVTVYDPAVLNVTIDQTPEPINLCDEVSYTVTIQNTGDTAATNVTVHNSMPTEFTQTASTTNPCIIPSLAAGAAESCSFSYTASCDAVSGENSTTISYVDESGGQSYDPPNTAFTVVPGAITITKMATKVNGTPLTPATSEPSAELGDTITWRIRVENTGYGRVDNVVVTDSIGAGLSFSDGSPGSEKSIALSSFLPPRPSGITNPPGDSCAGQDWCEDIEIETDIIACQDLKNTAEATWGCGSQNCGEPVKAESSVHFQPDFPYLSYTPQDITLSVPYCSTTPVTQTRTLTIENSGTSDSSNTVLALDFAPLTINNVTSTPAIGVTYNTAATRFEFPERDGVPGLLRAGESVTIQYDVSYTPDADWCSGANDTRSGRYFWEPSYEDPCGNTFTPPVKSSTYTVTADASQKPTITVTKTCSFGSVLLIGENPQTVTCDVTIEYSGLTSCGSGSAGTLTVTDDYPNEWTLNSITPQGSTPPTGLTPPYAANEVSWTISPSDTLTEFHYEQEFRIPGIGEDNICASCGQERQNTVTVSGTDCCGCELTEEETVSTYITCPGDGAGISSSRTIQPSGPYEICTDNLSFNSSYTFSGTQWDSASWTNSMTFTEHNEGQMTLLPGTPTVSVTASPANCQPAISPIPAGGTTTSFSFEITGPGTCAANIGDGTILTVSYEMQPSESTMTRCEAEHSFVDYAQLDVSLPSGAPSSGVCTSGGNTVTIKDANWITTHGSNMEVNVEWDPVPADGVVGPCGEYNATITLTKSSAAPAYDVVLFVENANYDTLSLTACSIQPTNQTSGCSDVTPDAATQVTGGYAFHFGDAFSGAANQAVLRIRVQADCLTSSPELNVHLGYNDACSNQTPDPADLDYTARHCHDPEATVSGRTLESNLIVSKFPEEISAKWNGTNYDPIEWTINVTNSGSGSAFNVEVLDTLGTDLQYGSSSWDNPADITTYEGTRPDGSTPLNGASYVIKELAAGENRKLTFAAELNGCQQADNEALARVRCLNMAETAPCSSANGTSVVTFPPSNVVATTSMHENLVDPCRTTHVILTARNAGLTPLYNIRLNQILPEGLSYDPDPAVSGSQASYWYENPINGSPPALPTPPAASTWHGAGQTEPSSPIAPGYGATLHPPKANPPAGTSSYYWDASSTTDPDLQAALTQLNPGETVYIAFPINVACDFTGGTLRFYMAYDQCGSTNVASSLESTFSANLRTPEITVTKTRNNEPIACNEEVSWTITVTNNNGYDMPILRVQDRLGAAFSYVSHSSPSGVDSAQSGQQITWEFLNFAKNHSETMTVTARSDSAPCNTDITNTVEAWWGCGTADGVASTQPGTPPDNADDICLTDTPVQVVRTETREPAVGFMQVPTPSNPISSCDDNAEFRVVLQNSGPTDVEDLDLTVTLPNTLHYNSSPTPLYCVGPDETCTPATTITPTVAGQVLTFGNTSDTTINLVDTLDKDGGNDTLVLVFTVQSQCYVTSQVPLQLSYYDCCGVTQYTTNATQEFEALFPELEVSKEPTSADGVCDSTSPQTWTITVTNTGTAEAQVVRVEDTLGDWIDYQSSSPAATPLDTPAGQRYGWEFNNLSAGASRSFEISGALHPDGSPNQADCAAALRQNTVRAKWICGTTGDAVDGNPLTTSDYTCEDPTWETAAPATLRMPDLQISSATPTLSCSGGKPTGSIDLTIHNAGDGGASGSFTIRVTEPTISGWERLYTHTGLNAGASETVTIPLDNLPVDCDDCQSYNFDLEIDSAGTVCECDESNNSLSVAEYSPCASIGNFVWLDANGDGVQQPGEAGIPGVTVYLLDSNGDRLKDSAGNDIVTTTDSSGHYLFDHLLPGDYGLEFEAPDGYKPSPENAGGDDALDSDADALSGKTAVTTLSAGENDLSWDAGFFLPVSVGNRVWFDMNADGVQDKNASGDYTEPGIENVRLRLQRSDDGGTSWLDSFTDADRLNVSDWTTNTDSNGHYLFENLRPGNYRVVVIQDNWADSTRPFGSSGTYPGAYGSPGSGATTGSNTLGDPVNNDDNGDHDNAVPLPTDPGVLSELIELRSGGEPSGEDAQDKSDNCSELSIDFGFHIRDFGDLPDSYGTLLSSSGAHHALDGETWLGAGVDGELTGVPTATAVGDDEAGSPDDEDGVRFLDPIMPGQTFRVEVTAHGDGYLNAWMDFDGAGFGAGDQLNNGTFLSSGTHTLSFTAPASPAPFAQTIYSRFRFSKAATDGGNSPTGLARSGEVEDYALMSLGNQLWFDNGNDGAGNFISANSNNGRFDSGEDAVPAGVEVWLYREGQTPGSTPIARTTTDSNGQYLFTGLTAGNYVVHIPSSQFQSGGPLEGYISSTGAADPDNNVDHDADENGIDETGAGDMPEAAGIHSNPVTLQLGDEPSGNGNSNLTVDFGLIPMPILHIVKTGNTTHIQPCERTDNPNTPETEPLVFTITLSNVGQDFAAMRLIHLTDLLPNGWELQDFRVPTHPTGLTWAQSEITGPDGSHTILVEFDKTPAPPGRYFLPSDGDIVIELEVIVNSTTNPDVCKAAYQFTNEASVLAYDPRNKKMTADSSSDPTADTVHVDCPALHVVTQVQPIGSLEPCSDITYTITVDNLGGAASTLEDIRVNDSLPAHFRVNTMRVMHDGTALTEGDQYAAYVVTGPATTAPYPGTPFNGPATLEWFFGSNSPDGRTLPNPISLPPGQVLTITLSGRFSETACGMSYAAKILATAGADLCGLAKQPTSDSVLQLPATHIACPKAELKKTLVSEPAVLPGHTAVYTLEAINTGSPGSYLYDLEITDRLPQGWTLVSTSVRGANGSSHVPQPGASGELKWTFDGAALRGGQRLSISLEIAADLAICGQAAFCNSAELTASTHCGSPVNAKATATGCVTSSCPTPTPMPTATPAARPGARPEARPTFTPLPMVEPGATATPTPTPDAARQIRFDKRREASEDSTPCMVVPAEIRKPWFITDISMYAASELYASSAPMIKWSEQNGLTLDRSRLSPTGVQGFGAEVFEYSVENIITLMSNSGLGLHLKYAPFITAGASSRGLEPERYLNERVQAHAQRAGLHSVPHEIYPLFIEYAEGDPRYTQMTDLNNWATLRWDPQSFHRHLIPSAYGQTLLRQTLLLQRAAASRKSSERLSGQDETFGLMEILAVEAIVNKMWFMAEHLLNSAENDAGTLLPYFPYQTSVAPADSGQTGFQVDFVNTDSRLFDQLSLLWALSEVMLLTDPTSHELTDELFSHELLTPDVDFSRLRAPLGLTVTEMSPATVHNLAEALAAIVFKTLTDFHWLDEAQTLLERVRPGLRNDPTQAPAVEAVSLGLSLVALERYDKALGADNETRTRIKAIVSAVADSLLAELLDPERGGLFSRTQVNVDDQTAADDRTASLKTLQSQMAGIRGLLSAYTMTQNERYRSKAFELYAYTVEHFWNKRLNMFTDRERNVLYRYTPMDLGLTSGALRELIYHSRTSSQTHALMNKKQHFVRQLAQYAGLQLSETINGSEREFLIPVAGNATIRAARLLDSPFGVSPVLGSEITLNRSAIAALNAERSTGSCEQGRRASRTSYYLTDIGMYAASEFALQHVPTRAIADESADNSARKRNPELLHPAAIERTLRKASDFSDQNLIHIVTKSGLGVDLRYGPLVKKTAARRGLSVDAYMQDMLAHYADLAGLQEFPKSLKPIFLEYEGGVPEVGANEDDEGWFDGNKDMSILPSALGQSLRRQVLWLQDVLSDRHDAENHLSRHGQYLGRNAEEGFLGLVTAQAVANKILFLKESMLRPLTFKDASNASGVYFPHRLEIDFTGEAPKVYELQDSSSSLFDQVSLLWGLSELYGLLDASDSDAPYRAVFNDETLAAIPLRSLTQELTSIVLENLSRLHWDAASGSFFDWNDLDSDRPGNNADDARRISTEQIALLAIALQSTSRSFDSVPDMRRKADTLLLAQADFLSRWLYHDEDGSVYNGARLGETITAFTGVKTLLAHSAAVRTLLAAYQQSGDAEYLRKARKAAETLDKEFWDQRLGTYKSAYGQYHYTPLNTAMTVGAFRGLLAVDRSLFMERYQEHFSDFFEQTVRRIGLQLSEYQRDIERKGGALRPAPVLASDLTIRPAGSSTDASLPQPGSVLTYSIVVADEELRCSEGDAYVEDMLPEGLQFIKSYPIPEDVHGRRFRWRVADLPMNENGMHEIRLLVRVYSQRELDSAGGRWQRANTRGPWGIKNCASLWCVDPLQGGQMLKRDCVDDEIAVPVLSLEKSSRSVTTEPGRDVTLEIKVSNLSEVTAYAVTLESESPEGFSYIPDSMHSRDSIELELEGRHPLLWSLGDLKPGASRRLSYAMSLDPRLQEGSYRSRLSVHALDRSGHPLSTRELFVHVEVKRRMALAIDWTEQRAVTRNTSTLALRMTNTGSKALARTTVHIDLPKGVRYTLNSSRLDNMAFRDPEALAPQTLSWAIGLFEPGEVKTLEFSVQTADDRSRAQVFNAVIQGLTDDGADYRSPEKTLSFPRESLQ